MKFDPNKPLDLAGEHFAYHKYEHYAYLREHLPVSKGKISVMKVNLLSRYEDCLALVKDSRFVRNKTSITEG